MRSVKRGFGSWTFVPPGDQKLPAAEQTTFVLKPLTQLQRMECWDNLNWVNPDGTAQPRAFQQARELCITNIEAVENFPVGSPAPWPQSLTEREKYLEQFDDMDVLVIGNEIRDRSGIGDEPKNSSPPVPIST